MIDLGSDDVPILPSPLGLPTTLPPDQVPVPPHCLNHCSSTVGDKDEIPPYTCQSNHPNPTPTGVLLSDLEVVLNDYTNGDHSTITSSSTSSTPLLPLPSDSQFSHNLSPEPMVALSGCTDDNQSCHTLIDK